jgi:hypothetical protein
LILLPHVATLDGMDPLPPAGDAVPESVGGRLRDALDEGEAITHLVPAIGCVVALTQQRLLVVREGSAFRPKTGVREWLLQGGLLVRAGLVRHGTGSLAIRWDREATSVFVREEHWDDALALVAAVRGKLRVDEAASRRSARHRAE